MNRLTFPQTLPLCNGITPAFKDRFSGWHLGMGLPDTLTGLMHGLSVLGEQDQNCRNVAVGMAFWGIQAHPLAPTMAAWAAKLSASGLRLAPGLGKLVVRLAPLQPLGNEDTESMETWYALARQDDRSLILRFLTLVLRDRNKDSPGSITSGRT